MLFYPLKPHLLIPSDRGIDFQDIYIKTANDRKLHGWVLPQDGELKGTVLFFHGNGENISTHIGAVYWLPKHGYRVLLVDYRGYGKSEGEATLDGSIEDIQFSLKYAVEHSADSTKDKPLVVLGQSIGASMSIYALANSNVKNKIDGLILLAPFSDYHRIAQETLSKSWLTWLFQYPLSWTISNEYQPLKYIKAISPVPVYFIHGKSDKLIKPDHSMALHKQAIAPKKLILLPGGHNDLAASEEYRTALLNVLREIETEKQMLKSDAN